MLPALPVEEISARGAEMAGAGRDSSSSGGKARGTRAASGKPAAKPAAKKPSAKTAPAKKASGPKAPGTTVKPAKTVKAAKAPAKAPAAKAAGLPVRAGEDRWTPAELAEVRAALEAEKTALRAEIIAAESQIAEGDASDGAGDDQADAGSKTYEREHEMSLAANVRDLLEQTERAVQRMDAGTYGTCESCAQPIGKARLQAFPRATMCIPCRTREERR